MSFAAAATSAMSDRLRATPLSRLRVSTATISRMRRRAGMLARPSKLVGADDRPLTLAVQAPEPTGLGGLLLVGGRVPEAEGLVAQRRGSAGVAGAEQERAGASHYRHLPLQVEAGWYRRDPLIVSVERERARGVPLQGDRRQQAAELGLAPGLLREPRLDVAPPAREVGRVSSRSTRSSLNNAPSSSLAQASHTTSRRALHDDEAG